MRQGGKPPTAPSGKKKAAKKQSKRHVVFNLDGQIIAANVGETSALPFGSTEI